MNVDAFSLCRNDIEQGPAFFCMRERPCDTGSVLGIDRPANLRRLIDDDNPLPCLRQGCGSREPGGSGSDDENTAISHGGCPLD